MEELVKLIRDWDENPEMRVSYPYGLSQYIEESSSDRNYRTICKLLEILYNDDLLKDILKKDSI